MDRRYESLDDAAGIAREFIETLPDRPVGARAGLDELRRRLARPLRDGGEDPRTVIRELARDVEPGLVASAGPRYFGFVIGGAQPVALGADWLTSTWDQNAAGFAPAPALSVVEEIAAGWLRDLLGLPAGSSIGFVTGCQMAHFTCLAAARHRLLGNVGHDVEARGLTGAPAIRILAGEHAHVTVSVACRLLGLGTDQIRSIPSDDQGRMNAATLQDELRREQCPTIVCAQLGEIHTGAVDPISDIVAACREHGAWCHVDGAFGLWGAASSRRRGLFAGYERADSWATDGHKWLNVPYDCGIAAVADPAAHRAAMTSTAAYVPDEDRDTPQGRDWSPEFSRRARGVPVYAVLRSLGRRGLADMIDRCCDHARHLAERLAKHSDVEVVNEVVLNQVLVRFFDDDEATLWIIDSVQRDGTCWLGGSTFRERAVMRISIVGWQTTDADVERSADAILSAVAAAARRF